MSSSWWGSWCLLNTNHLRRGAVSVGKTHTETLILVDTCGSSSILWRNGTCFFLTSPSSIVLYLSVHAFPSPSLILSQPAARLWWGCCVKIIGSQLIIIYLLRKSENKKYLVRIVIEKERERLEQVTHLPFQTPLLRTSWVPSTSHIPTSRRSIPSTHKATLVCLGSSLQLRLLVPSCLFLFILLSLFCDSFESAAASAVRQTLGN